MNKDAIVYCYIRREVNRPPICANVVTVRHAPEKTVTDFYQDVTNTVRTLFANSAYDEIRISRG